MSGKSHDLIEIKSAGLAGRKVLCLTLACLWPLVGAAGVLARDAAPSAASTARAGTSPDTRRQEPEGHSQRSHVGRNTPHAQRLSVVGRCPAANPAGLAG